MLVILGVAADAFPRQFSFVGNRDFVTAGTLQVAVSARQRIRGLFVVIELPAIPTVRGVAGTTDLSECAFVIVAIRVAIAAHLRHSREIELRMTRFTRGGRVNAD